MELHGERNGEKKGRGPNYIMWCYPSLWTLTILLETEGVKSDVKKKKKRSEKIINLELKR